MTIQHALDFIKRGQQDTDLRHKLVKTSGKEALDAALASEHLNFSLAEFEEAYSLILFRCQDPGDAHALMAFRMWWVLLTGSADQEDKEI